LIWGSINQTKGTKTDESWKESDICSNPNQSAKEKREIE